MSAIATTAAGGTYTGALMQGILGGYGNTVPTLLALLTAVIGLARTWLGTFAGATAWVAGKALGTIMFLGTLLAVFSNGVMVYLKSKPEGAIYVDLLGPLYFEAIVCVMLVIGFIAKNPAKKQ